MGRSRTSTSDFGVSKREGHDASKFYGSKLYEGITIDDSQKVIDNSLEINDKFFNQRINFNQESISNLPDYSVHLMIFKVPALIKGKESNLDSFFEKIQQIIIKIQSKLILGGRLIVLVNNQVDLAISKSGFFPLHAYIGPMIINQGLYMRGEVILTFNKKDNFNSKEIPISANVIHSLNQVYDHGLIFSNRQSKRIKKGKNAANEKTDTISRDQFLEYTKSVWYVIPELMTNKKKIESIDIEEFDYLSRFIHLYSFLEDTIMIIANEINDKYHALFIQLRKRNLFITLNDNL